MTINRGARGWEAPRVASPQLNWSTNPPSREEVERALFEMQNPSVVDMVPVNGVWMTREDARKA